MLWKPLLVLTTVAILIVATLPVSTMTFAQTLQESWQEFRRDELGFKVEMPGTPQVEEEEEEEIVGNTKKTIKSTSVQLNLKDGIVGCVLRTI